MAPPACLSEIRKKDRKPPRRVCNEGQEDGGYPGERKHKKIEKEPEAEKPKEKPKMFVPSQVRRKKKAPADAKPVEESKKAA